jgi:tRNA (guanine37-N1)-methyltransferase
MKIHIITIFPEMFDSYFKTSIMWRAIDKCLLELYLYKLNDFSDKNTKRVDNKAYWMHWQVICAEPLSKAIEFIFWKVWKKIPVVYMSPSWEILNQEKVEYYSENLWDEIIIICGHYEGIDQRIIDLYVDYEISIWKYIISSWELASMVFIDSLVRIIPWVIWNNLSHEEESFSKKLDRKKEYPLYTKPEIFAWLKVPSVLLSGNHKDIENWKTTNLKS